MNVILEEASNLGRRKTKSTDSAGSQRRSKSKTRKKLTADTNGYFKTTDRFSGVTGDFDEFLLDFFLRSGLTLYLPLVMEAVTDQLRRRRVEVYVFIRKTL